MRSLMSSCVLLACALGVSEAAAQEKSERAGAPPAARPRDTRIVRFPGGGGFIRYEVWPGDEEKPPGELIVVPAERRPAVARLPTAVEAEAAEETAREGPPSEERAFRRPPPRFRAEAPCAELRGRLAVRLLQLRGFETDPVTARWVLRRLFFFGEGLPLAAIQSDLAARTLATELAHCDAEAARR